MNKLTLTKNAEYPNDVNVSLFNSNNSACKTIVKSKQPRHSDIELSFSDIEK